MIKRVKKMAKKGISLYVFEEDVHKVVVAGLDSGVMADECEGNNGK